MTKENFHVIICGAISKVHSSGNLSGVRGESLAERVPCFFVLFPFKLIHFIPMLSFLASLSAYGGTHAQANPLEADSNK